jgi:DNA polymerase
MTSGDTVGPDEAGARPAWRSPNPAAATPPPGLTPGQHQLDLLAKRIAGCPRCPELVATRTHPVPGELQVGHRLVLVGEAPGQEEDRSGRPFVGRSGQLLERVLAESGLLRSDVGIANVLKCRPPGNRPPARAEREACRGYLEAQLTAVDPVVVLALGGTAVSWFLGPAARLTRLRGQVLDWRGRTLLVTYHPSAALRFGPNGQPMAALRADVAHAVVLAGLASVCGGSVPGPPQPGTPQPGTPQPGAS